MVMTHPGYFFKTSAFLLSVSCPTLSMSAWSNRKKTGWNGEF
jgi:hypothetical protein